MDYIDVHAHMISRTTDDYERMALAGCVALTEPAFWAGYDRRSADVFADYFTHLTEFEPSRDQLGETACPAARTGRSPSPASPRRCGPCPAGTAPRPG